MPVLTRNYRCLLGEIDLIARDEDYLVFVEVKYRYNDAYGEGQFHVDRRKQHRIFRVAEWFLTQRGNQDVPCRFDVIAIDGTGRIEHIKNAFEKAF